MEISFTVPGQPIAKARPRFGKGKVYTAPSTKSFEHAVGVYASMVCKKPLEGAVSLSIIFCMKAPKSGKEGWHISRPDLTNLIKAIEDGMNGIVFKDDAQIAQITCSKVYSNKPETSIVVRHI